ncbi:MAG: hypothetical protein ACRDJB_01370 [Actinomycetota bacterium]
MVEAQRLPLTLPLHQATSCTGVAAPGSIDQLSNVFARALFGEPLMDPRLRSYADSYDGLDEQLVELRGFIRVVPPLIQEDRDRRWTEIGSRPGDPDREMIDIYESEAGPGEGWGHADFARILYSAAIITAWEVFRVYLVQQLHAMSLRYNLTDHPALAIIVLEERRRLDRRFEAVQRRYKEFASIELAKIPGWDAVLHAQALRNALVHNLGHFTQAYLNTGRARRPTKEDAFGFSPPKDDADLIDEVSIPLSEAISDQVIEQLLEFAAKVKDALADSR